jgi:hypothetical protein
MRYGFRVLVTLVLTNALPCTVSAQPLAHGDAIPFTIDVPESSAPPQGTPRFL